MGSQLPLLLDKENLSSGEIAILPKEGGLYLRSQS